MDTNNKGSFRENEDKRNNKSVWVASPDEIVDAVEDFDEENDEIFVQPSSLQLPVRPASNANYQPRGRSSNNEGNDDIDNLYNETERRSTARDLSPPPSTRSSTATFGGSRTGTPMLDQTLSAAFRDKIRNRIQTAKVKKKHKSPRDDSWAQENIQIDEQINSRIKTRLLWRHGISRIIASQQDSQELFIPTPEESYLFFTKPADANWDSDETVGANVLGSNKEELPDSAKETSHLNNEKADEVEDEETDDTRLLIQELFASTDKFNLFDKAKPELKSSQDLKDEENSSLFYPTTKKLNNDLRYQDRPNYDPTADGLTSIETILRRNYASTEKSINKLEQRIQKEGGTNWLIKFLNLITNGYFDEISFSQKFISDKNVHDYSDLVEFRPPGKMEELMKREIHATGTKYELIIEICSMKFTHHILFAEENSVSGELLDYFKTYKTIFEDKSILFMTQKFQALHMSITNLETQLAELTEEGESNELLVEKQQRINYYRQQALKTLVERREKVKIFRNVLLSLLSSWDDLKNIRQRTGFTSTNLMLKYQEDSESVNERIEKKYLHDLVKEATELEVMLLKEQNEKAMEEYRKNLRNWKQWQRNQRRLSKFESDINSSSLGSPECGSTTQIDDVNPSKPEVPVENFDETAISERIKQDSLLLDGRLPGEPKFYALEIDYSFPITPDKVCPKHEQKRRQELSNHRYSLGIYVDDELVAHTTENEVSCNFIVSWEQKFSIKLSKEPRKIAFFINEKIVDQKKAQRIAEVSLPLPEFCWIKDDYSESSDNKSTIQFSYEKSARKSEVLNSGVITFNSMWGEDESGVVLCPSATRNPRNILDEDLESLSLEKLQQWKEKKRVNIDPNDPENINLLEAINEYENMARNNPKLETCFHLDPIMQEFKFCSEDYMDNPRFRLLKLRAQGSKHLKNVKIPMNEREIRLDLLEGMKKTSEIPHKLKKSYEAKRERALLVLTQVREQLIKQTQGRFERPRTLEDLVIEDESTGMTFGFDFFSATGTRRPLHPPRKERKKIFGSLMANHEINIIVTIMHALNVAVRTDNGNSSTKRSSIGELDFSTDCKVSPFVEAVFQRESCRTSSASGPQPTWNETLSLPFRPPNDDCSPVNLTKISDYVYLNLFDEVIFTQENEEISDQETLASQRVERRWLGSIRIPFSTLYLNSKVEGTFGLKAPSVLLGYEFDNKSWKMVKGSSSNNPLRKTYLTFFITIDPKLQLPEPIPLKCDSAEDENILQYAQSWEQELRTQFPERIIKVLAIDMNTQWVLIPRYLRPLKPHDELLQNIANTDDVMQRIARFVSLIPSIPDSIALPGIGDIWSNCSQFLEMLMADEEEHAVLLCNFFIFLGKRAGVLLGSGIPEGSTAYVITWEYTGEEPSVWNATCGEKFNVRDSYLPLNTIGCIFTPDNVYANIQKFDHPNRMNYDITKTADWRPLFSRKFLNPGLTSIQPEQLDFGAIDYEYAIQLQEKIEKHLRECLMKWRKKSRTFFNRSCIQQLRKILPRLEKKVGKFQQSDMIQDLQDILVVHKMTGFPLNFPFTDIKSITEDVYATGVHLIEDKKVEFALVVYIHPYPCNVLSVWVYIAALTRNN